MPLETPLINKPDNPTEVGRAPRFNGSTLGWERFSRPLSSRILVQPGTPLVSSSPGQRIYNICPGPWVLASVEASLGTAASSGSTVVQVYVDGVLATTLTLAAGANVTSVVLTTSIARGSYLQARVTQVGVGAADLAVQINGIQVVQDGPYSAAQTLPWALYDAESGQPKGVGYVQLSGATGDYISTPDAPLVDLTDGIDIVARVAADNWAPAIQQQVISKLSSGTTMAFSFEIMPGADGLGLRLSHDGTTKHLSRAGVALPFTAGQVGWIRATWRLSDNRVQFFTAPDQVAVPTSWTQLGTDKTSGMPAVLYNSASPLTVSGPSGSVAGFFAGKVYRAVVRSAIDGPVSADFDASKCFGPGYLNEGTLPTDSNGARYVPLSGQSGDYVWTADRPALRITGDIEVVARVAPDSWTSVGNQRLASRMDAGVNRSYSLLLTPSGNLRFEASPDGTGAAVVGESSTVNLAATAAGTALWVKATLDVDNGSGSRVYQFFTAPDQVAEPSSWTPLGATVTTAGTTSIFAGTMPLEIGSRAGGTTDRFAGRVYRVIVRNGIGGTKVADFDASKASTFVQANDGYGNGWAINSPKHHGNWTIAVPKVYDTSGNNHPPATFGSGSNRPTWLPWTGNSYVYLPGVASNHVYSANGPTKTSIVYWDVAVKFAFDVVGSAQTLAGISSTHFSLSLTSNNKLLISLLMTDLVNRVGNAESPAAVPGLLPGLPIWVRGRVSQASALCEYWYSFDATDDASQVNWISLGSVVGLNAGGTVLLSSSAAVLYGTFSAGVGGAAGKLYAGQQTIDDGVAPTTNRFRASTMLQQATSPCDTGQLIGVSRSSAGRKTVVQSPAARSARSVILLGTDDWIDVPAVAVPPLDTFQPPSAVAAVLRRWHNSGVGHVVFATKSTYSDTVLGFMMRMQGSAGGTGMASSVGDGTNAEVISALSVPVSLGARAVYSSRVGNVAPFVDIRGNGQVVEDLARGTASSTSSGSAGRVGALLGGGNATDMEFEALATYRRDPGANSHAALVAGHNGGQ